MVARSLGEITLDKDAKKLRLTWLNAGVDIDCTEFVAADGAVRPLVTTVTERQVLTADMGPAGTATRVRRGENCLIGGFRTKEIVARTGRGTCRHPQETLRHPKLSHLGERVHADTRPVFWGSIHPMLLPLREVETVLDWLEVNRCSQAI